VSSYPSWKNLCEIVGMRAAARKAQPYEQQRS
jgi:hypothetical protein